MKKYFSPVYLTRLCSSMAVVLASLGISMASSSGAIIINPGDITPKEDTHIYEYKNFTYSNVTSVANIASVTGFKTTEAAQSGGNSQPGSSRWVVGNALSGSVTYTFDFSSSGYTPTSFTIEDEAFRSFGGYVGSAAIITGRISVNGGETWTTIYSANITGTTSSYARNIVPQGPISLLEIAGGTPVDQVLYQFSYEVTAGSGGAFIAYNYAAYDTGATSLVNITFDVAPIPEPTLSAFLILGGALIAWKAAGAGRKRMAII